MKSPLLPVIIGCLTVFAAVAEAPIRIVDGVPYSILNPSVWTVFYFQTIVVGKTEEGLLCRCVTYQTQVNTSQFTTLSQQRTSQSSTTEEVTAHPPILVKNYPGWKFIDVGKNLVSPLKVATTGFYRVGLTNYEVCDLGIEYYPPPKVLTPAELKKLENTKARALRSLMKEATNGEAWAQTSLGLRYLKGDGVPKDFDQATNWLWQATFNGDMEASNKLNSLTATNKPEGDE